MICGSFGIMRVKKTERNGRKGCGRMNMSGGLISFDMFRVIIGNGVDAIKESHLNLKYIRVTFSVIISNWIKMIYNVSDA